MVAMVVDSEARSKCILQRAGQAGALHEPELSGKCGLVRRNVDDCAQGRFHVKLLNPDSGVLVVHGLEVRKVFYGFSRIGAVPQLGQLSCDAVGDALEV